MFFLKKFRCEKCQKKFRQQEELMQHEQVVHGKDIPYECKECKQSFTSMEQMRTHLQRHHSYSGKRDT
jgi:DNA-directed RNA polymerase subunit RPC12/RpoP